MSDWLDPECSIPLSTMLTANFNQDGSCLAIGLEDGFEVYSMPPFQKSITRKLGGSLGQLEMLFRCHLFALVGSRLDNSTYHHHLPPYSPPNRVLIWDDHNLKAIGELTFRQTVLQVKLRRDAIAVALRDRVYVYNLRELTLRDKIYTTDNSHGLLSISTSTSTTMMGGTATASSSSSPLQDMVLACPSVTEGHVRVELYGWRKTVLVPAHESALRAIALTPDGTRLATASIKGTVVRVFSILSSGPPQLLQEFRRGIDRVQMTCLAWSWDHRHVACCSDKGTAHVFQLKETQTEPTDTSNTNNNDPSKEKNKSSSSWYKSIKKTIFSSDLKHSISQVRGIPHPIACTFVPNLPNTLAVVGWDIDGNGVVSLNDYSQEEAIRTGYHVIAKSAMDASPSVADEGTTRRKRMLQSTKDHVVMSTEDSNNGTTNPIVQIGDRMELLEHQTQEIQFREEEDEDEGFLNILGLEHKSVDEKLPVTDIKKDDDDVDNDKDDEDDFQDTPQELPIQEM